MMQQPPQRRYQQIRKKKVIDISAWRLPLVRFRWNRRKTFITIGVVFGLSILFQVIYPGDMLPINAHVDGVAVGGKTRADAAKKLDEAYKQYSVQLVGDGKTIATPTLEKLAMQVHNTERVENVQYPWYWRIIPLSSLWWQPSVSESPRVVMTDQTKQYIDSVIMPVCKRAPVNATLKVASGKLSVVPSQRGGECERSAVEHSIGAINPILTIKTSVDIPMKGIEPTISTKEAEMLQKDLTKTIGRGVSLQVKDETVIIPANEIIQWITTAVQDKKIEASIGVTQAQPYLAKNVAPKVAVAPGVTRVTTFDFSETSRSNGSPGRALDLEATTQQLTKVIRGNKAKAAAVTKVIQPTVEYSRKYSSTDSGLNALLKQYADDHPGTYGVSMIELDGQKRSANYNGDKQFVTASTYKLYVGYSVLKRVESSGWRWEDNQSCFNKMISLSDNACAENFLRVIGLSEVTKDAKGAGFNSTTFMKSGGPFTTPDDLARFMGMLESGQGLNNNSRERFLSALKANVYRKGIPAGATGTVADKVGFLNGLLHDSAIVYSPHGRYTLAIMTDGSSWANIAELTKKIEEVRNQS